MIMHFLLPLAIVILHDIKLAEAQSVTKILCQQYESVVTTSGRYTFSTDQWGLDASGFQCMNVSLNDVNSKNSTSFSATWQWANQSTVHAFPNINLNSASLPLQLSNLHTLQLTATWTMSPNNLDSISSPSDLSTAAAVANVALDMFLDADPTLANSTTKSAYEIMIWQAAYGGQRPIGWGTVTADSPKTQLNGQTYTLSHGLNGVNQSVYTWYPSSNITAIDTDVSPLLHYLWRGEYLPESTYLGLVQWGSEATHSAQGHNVTFVAESVSIGLEVGMPKASQGARARPACAVVILGLGGVLVLGLY